MIKRILYIFLILLSSNISFAQKEKFQVNGAARAYLFSNDLLINKDIDTVSTKKSNYGHTLLDLGFSIFPNNNTEIISIFRIRNELGGFWGGGTSFNVRQLTLKGVAGNIVKYELGDIDLKLTKYTLYNNTEEGVINESDLFKLKRDIVYYDMFYTPNNTWRMQGAKTQFGLNFNKGIKKIDVTGYITRQRPTDGISQPERLYGGGQLNIVQSKVFELGFNSINLFDLTKTTTDSIQFSNSVHTTNTKIEAFNNDKMTMTLLGEGGISYSNYNNYNDIFIPEKNNDWFYDAALKTEIKKQNVSLTIGYKDVGSDFTSPGSQTKRINYAKSPGLYQQFTNEYVARPTGYNDFINGNASNTFKITEQLMAYNAAYNNSTPYGFATPNRKGTYLEAVKNDTNIFRKIFITASYLSESKGSGTNVKKNFIVVRGGTDIYLNDLLSWKKDFKINLGAQYENTQRAGEVYEKINLSSMFIDAGLSIEFVDDFNFLVGMKYWQAKGNEYYAQRDKYNTIINYVPLDINFSELTYIGGLKYNFNDKNILSVLYEMYTIKYLENSGINYGINTFNILYTLNF